MSEEWFWGIYARRDFGTLRVLGVTSKPNTDVMRSAPSVNILQSLQAMGAKVQVYEGQGANEAAYMLPSIEACVVMSEWNQFRALDLDHLRFLTSSPVFVDLRTVDQPIYMARSGLPCASIGLG